MSGIIYKTLKENAEKYGDKPAILYDTIEVSYSKLYRDAVKKALHLQRFEGERIALYGPASYRWIVNMFGILLSGKDLIITDFFAPQNIRKKMLRKTNANYVLTATNQYILSTADETIIPGADKDDTDGLIYDENTKLGKIIMFTATRLRNDKPFVVEESSICHAIDVINTVIECEPEDKLLSQIPLHKAFGLIYALLWPLFNGACVCIGRGLRHIDADTHYYHPTILPATPSMIGYLKKVKAFNEELNTVVIGAGFVPFRILEELRDRNIKAYSVYGRSEACSAIAINETIDGSYKILDKDSVSISDTGEILYKGDCCMVEYLDDREASDEIFEGGVMHTGDHGRINTEGKLVVNSPNPDVILFPTGEELSRNAVMLDIEAINGIAECYVTYYEEKLTLLLRPVNKDIRRELLLKKIDKYNEQMGYRWEIQKSIILDEQIPKCEDGNFDEDAIKEIIVNQQ